MSDWDYICLECDSSLLPWEEKCPSCGLRRSTPHPLNRLLDLNGTYVRGTERLYCVVEGVPVIFSWGEVVNDQRFPGTPYIKAVATYVLENGPVFRVVPTGSVTWASRRSGKDRIVFGQSTEFEPRYTTRGESEATLRRVWSLDLQEQMVPLFPDAEVVSDGRTVTIYKLRRSHEEEVIRLAAGLAGALWRSLLVTLRQLPDATYTPSIKADPVPRVRVPGLTDVSFEPVSFDDSLRVRAIARVAPRSTPSGFDADATVAADSQAFPPAMSRLLRELGDARVRRVGDALEVAWTAPQPGLRQYEAALELFRSLAADSQQPYR